MDYVFVINEIHKGLGLGGLCAEGTPVAAKSTAIRPFLMSPDGKDFMGGPWRTAEGEIIY